MEEDESKAEKSYPLSTAKMSKTPSWIMLGFVLGAVFVIALPPLGKKPAPDSMPARVVEPPRSAEPHDPPELSTIEAVFAEWGQHAVWADDMTEVVLWNTREKAFKECYEVRRIGGVFYFRTISRLTRRIIFHGKPMPDSPLQFTETEEQYREWLSYGRAERPLEQRDLRPTPRSSATESASPPRVEATSPAFSPPQFERVSPDVPAPAPPPPAKK